MATPIKVTLDYNNRRESFTYVRNEDTTFYNVLLTGVGTNYKNVFITYYADAIREYQPFCINTIIPNTSELILSTRFPTDRVRINNVLVWPSQINRINISTLACLYNTDPNATHCFICSPYISYVSYKIDSMYEPLIISNDIISFS